MHNFMRMILRIQMKSISLLSVSIGCRLNYKTTGSKQRTKALC
jgi:hypothetical protein